MSLLASPARLWRVVALAEAVTWALLLVGMVLKYLTRTTDLAVSVFGAAHGVVFLAYVVTTLVVALDQRWSPGRTLLGLAAAVPPLLTPWFVRSAERRREVGDRWRRVTPVPVALGGTAAVVVLTAAALAVGPPVG